MRHRCGRAGSGSSALQGCCDAFKAVPRVWNVHKSCRYPDFVVRGATSRILILQYQIRTLYEGSYVNKVRNALQGKEANKTWLYLIGQSHSPDFTPCDLLFFSLELSGVQYIATQSSKLQKALWTLYLKNLKQSPSHKCHYKCSQIILIKVSHLILFRSFYYLP